jgi:RNA polymerase sigma-70 factor (ECF subfamily)
MDHRVFLSHFLPLEQYLRTYLRNGSGSAQEADDLLQEVSGVLWKNFDQYDGARPFRAWATGIARLEVLKWRQRMARSRLVLSEKLVETAAGSDDGAPDEAVCSPEILWECMNDLSQLFREVLRLHYLESLSISTIAEQTGRSVGAVEMSLVRGRRKLRQSVARRLTEAAAVI